MTPSDDAELETMLMDSPPSFEFIEEPIIEPVTPATAEEVVMSTQDMLGSLISLNDSR